MQQLKIKLDDLIKAIKFLEAETNEMDVTIELNNHSAYLKCFDKQERAMEIKISSVDSSYYMTVKKEERLT